MWHILKQIKKAICVVALIQSSTCMHASDVRVRPAIWAQPMVYSGLDNWYKVDDNVYRSEQPSTRDMKVIREAGIKTVINLRSKHSDRKKIADTGLVLHEVTIRGPRVTREKIIEVLRIIKNSDGPVVIHCHGGSDRTGAVMAAYRIVFQGWFVDDAVDEMINGGYDFDRKYTNIIKLIREIDWDSMRQRLADSR